MAELVGVIVGGIVGVILEVILGDNRGLCRTFGGAA
jgi:hypothetical protein